MRPPFTSYTGRPILQLSRVWLETIRCLTAVLLAMGGGAIGQAQITASPLQVVSAANFRPIVAPESLATVFGDGFATHSAVGELDCNGQLPVTLEGVRVQVEGLAARLVFVSPTQINFVVPAGLPSGSRKVTVQLAGGETRETTVSVARYAPGLFTLPCLRGDRGAILDAVRFTMEPFQPVTNRYSGPDKQTRLALFGTGLRFAAGNDGSPIAVDALYGAGQKIQVPVEFAGPAPLFAGLDQVNLVVPAALENAGLVTLQLRAGEATSNAVTVMMASDWELVPGHTPGAYRVATLAGSGERSRTGDGGVALQGTFDTPVGIAIDKDGRRYIAEVGSRTIRRIGLDGTLATVYGNGRDGGDGDGGAASNASFRKPVSLAFDTANNLYIADEGDHRVRVVSPDGVIRSFAGTGTAGRAGVGGLATRAQLSAPSAVAVDAFGSILIADTGNHRILKITSDGLVSLVAGTGEPGYAGDGFAAYQAKLQSPGAMAPASDGTLFFADAGNRRIRRIDLNGTIRTVAGSGLDGDQRNACAPMDANLGWVAGLALDGAGTLWISDSKNHRVSALDASCLYAPIAGTGAAGFQDGNRAGESQFNEPRALAVLADGSILVADSFNNRIRRIAAQDSCLTLTALTFSSPDGGASLTGTVFAACVSTAPRTLTLRANFPVQNLPETVVLPAGADSVSFSLVPGPNASGRLLAVEASDGAQTVTGNWFSSPTNGSPGGTGSPTLTIQLPRTALVAGQSMSGSVILRGRPMPTQTVTVQLSTEGTGVSLASSVVIPAGQEQATFLVQTNAGSPAQDVTVRANTLGMGATAQFSLLPADGGGQGILASFLLTPSTETGGTAIAGLITLAAPAGANGVTVSLRSNQPSAQPPVSVRITPGSSSVGFSIGTSAVTAVTTATITATAGNDLSARLTIQPRGGAQTGEIGSLSLSPNPAPGGASPVLTVTLTAPAGMDGVLVRLTSSSSSALPPSTLLIPAGATRAQVEIPTTGVRSTTQATITATSANSRTIQMTILAPGTGSVPVAQITLQPSSVPGGDASLGTITLAAAAPDGGISVGITSSHSAAMPGGAVFLSAGSTQATFSIPTTSVAAAVQATITASSGGVNVSAVLTITPSSANLANIGSLRVAPASVPGGVASTGTVELQNPAAEGGVIIRLTAADPAATVPASLTIPAGQSSGTFTISTSGVTETKQISIVAASLNSVTTLLTITPGSTGSATVGGITITPSSVAGGASATGTVTLASPAPSGGVAISLSSNHPAATVPAVLVIPAGATAGTFAVATAAVPATITAVITAASANSMTASLTIQSGGAGQGTLGTLSISPQSVAGGGSASGTITLAAPAGLGGVLVNLSSGGPAATVPVSVVVPAGSSSGSFPIATSPVSMTTPVTISASSANSVSAVLTVQAPPTVEATIGSISIAPNSVSGGSTATGTVTLAAAAPAGGVRISLASSLPSATVPATIVVPAGQTAGTFLISTATVTSSQSATITATSANTVTATLGVQPASAAGTGTIGNISVAPSAVGGGGAATGTVTLGSPAGAGGVLVTLSSNSTAASVPASLLIAAGSASGTFPVSTIPVSSNTTVTITATSANTVSGTLLVQTSAPALAAIGTLSVSPNTVTGGSTATGTVTLVLPAAIGGVSVNLSSSDTAATLPSSLTIPAGQSIGTFAIPTTAVSTLRMATITASSLTTVTAGLTINPAAPASSTILGLTLSPASVTGGNPATGTVTLAAAAGSGGVVIALSSNNGAAGLPATLTIPAGSASGTFTVTTSPVGSATIASITAQSANTVTAALNIGASQPGVGTIGSLTLSPSTVASGAASTGTVTLAAPAPAGGVLVNLSSGNATATVPASVTVAAGSSSASFPISTAPVSSATTIAITASSANSVSANLTVQAAGPSLAIVSGLTLSPSSVVGGAGATGTVTLAVPATPGGVSVSLSSSDPSVTVPASVTIASGQSSATFAVSTSAVAAARTATITGTSLTSVSAQLSITPAGPNTVTLSGISLSPSSLQGGAAATGTVTLAAPAPAGGVSISLLSNSGNATTPASVSIAAGASSTTFSITTLPVGSSTTVSIAATSANTVSASLTIRPPCVSSLSLTVNITDLLSGGGLLSGPVTLTGPAPQGGMPIQFVAGSTNLGTVTIPEGQTSGSVSLTVSNLLSLIGSAVTALTGAPCGGVNVTLQLSSPLVAAVSIVPSTVTGGAGATGTISLAAAAPTGGATIGLVSSNPAIAAVNSSVTIPAGQTSATFAVTTTSPVATQTISITATAGNSRSASLIVNPAGVQIAAFSLSSGSVTGGSGATGTVTLTAPAPSGGALISLSSNHAAASVPASFTIAAGTTSGSFPITTSAVGANAQATIRATASNSATKTLTVLSPCVSGLTLSIGSLLGGQNTTGTVTLTGPAPAGGATIPLAYVGAGVTGPASVVVPAGATSANFTVGTAAVATILSSTIQALFGSCSPVTVNLSVTPAILSGISLTPSTLNLLGSSTGTVTLNGPAPAGGRVVSLSTNLLLSQLGFPSTVTIPAGATSANFTVNNLLSALSGLLQPLVGTLSGTLNGITVNTGITLKVL
ncbi:MAG TPA: hypothetical protein VFQ91_03355 [Bryobacteraceae bacterium]|nr:hypothetical protein [Bryobacteraceae bacterium]